MKEVELVLELDIGFRMRTGTDVRRDVRDVVAQVVAPGDVVGDAHLPALQMHSRPLTASMNENVESTLMLSLAHLSCLAHLSSAQRPGIQRRAPRERSDRDARPLQCLVRQRSSLTAYLPPASAPS